MSPDYYTKGRKYEPKDVIRDWNLNFNLGNVVKYVSRAGRKDPNTLIEDLLKARDYINFEIEYLYSLNEVELRPVGELRLKYEKCCCNKEGSDE